MKKYSPFVFSVIARLLGVVLCTLVWTITMRFDSAHAAEPDGQPIFHMHRLAGGQSYAVTVFPDGRVLYEGFWRVKTMGKAHYTLSPSQLNDLVDTLQRSDLFNLEVQKKMAVLERSYLRKWLILEAYLPNGNVKMVFGNSAPMTSVQNEIARVTEFVTPLTQIIDSLLNTRDLRCPFFMGRQSEVEICQQLKY